MLRAAFRLARTVYAPAARRGGHEKVTTSFSGFSAGCTDSAVSTGLPSVAIETVTPIKLMIKCSAAV